ncbi:MAG: hypothetical protein HY922_08440 [Elusimicrobia bacterium]|nr:hypothetical protein [Elusimicrobiota bacterium]
MKRNLQLCLLAAGCLYVPIVLFHHIASFPGLHGDEAWTGLFALSIRDAGLSSPHGLNAYTGSLYAWLLSKVFSIFGPGMLSLRALGSALNAAAALMMAAHFARRFGPENALAWLYLLASSAAFMLKSRIAWEVYALENFLLAAVVILCHRFTEKKELPFWGVLAFLFAIHAGVLNHFIFISAPLSLAAALFAYLVLLNGWELLELFLLSLAGLLMSACVFLAKPPLTEAVWMRWRVPLTLAWLLLPFAFAVAFKFAAPRAAGLRALLERAFSSRPLSRRAISAVLCLGLIAFFIFHWTALLQVWSGVAVLERLSSWSPPPAVALALYAWAAFLLGAFFVFALGNLRQDRLAQMPPGKRFLVCWALAYAAVFTLFTNTHSIRYYILPSFLIMSSLALILPDTLRRLRLAAAIPGLCAALFLNICFWRELRAETERRPIRFHIGWHIESSEHFLRLDALMDAADREKICLFEDGEHFTALPLKFHARSRKTADCDLSKRLFAKACWECESPPFFTWRVLRAGPRG